MAYKLIYFNLRGRAEPIRLLFALAGQEYEDVRLTDKDWSALKPTLPWGQVPVLQVGDKTITQTVTIARFLARRFGLVGDNEFETVKCDELVDAMLDVQAEWIRIRFAEKDETKKAEAMKTLTEQTIPKYLAKFENIQAENGGTFMVGKAVTWADAWIANALERFEEALDARILDKYPHLKRFKEAFFAIPNVKEYVARRL